MAKLFCAFRLAPVCRWWNPGRDGEAFLSQVVWRETHSSNLDLHGYEPLAVPFCLVGPGYSFFTTGTPVPSIGTYRMGTWPTGDG